MSAGALGTAFSTYPSTHWSLIYLASQPDQQAGEGALNELLCRYYQPLLAHVRFKFRLSEDASRDMIQGFVERKVLASQLLNSADRARGRFRTFLLNALDNYVIDVLRAQACASRKPAAGFVALQEFSEAAESVPSSDGADPYDRQWALTVIAEAERQTQLFYEAKGRGDTWAAFRDGFLLPTKGEAERPSDDELATRHGFVSARQASNAIITARRQFGKLLRNVVRQYADSDVEVDNEIRELMVLAGKG